MLQLLQPLLLLSSPAALRSKTFSVYRLWVQSSPWGGDAWSGRNAVIPADPTSCTLSLGKWKIFTFFPEVQSFQWCEVTSMETTWVPAKEAARFRRHQNHPPSCFSWSCLLPGTFHPPILQWSTAHLTISRALRVSAQSIIISLYWQFIPLGINIPTSGPQCI